MQKERRDDGEKRIFSVRRRRWRPTSALLPNRKRCTARRRRRRGSDPRAVVARACVLQRCARALVKSLGSCVRRCIRPRNCRRAQHTRDRNSEYFRWLQTRTHTHTCRVAAKIRGEKKERDRGEGKKNVV